MKSVNTTYSKFILFLYFKMIIFQLLFIYSCINFILKRSENTNFVRPNGIFTLINVKPSLTMILVFKLLQDFITLLMDKITLAFLLIIGGIERNPGPTNSPCKRCLLPACDHLIDCSNCSKTYDVDDIDIPLFIYHYLFESKGKFFYICMRCCDAREEEELIEKYFDCQILQNPTENVSILIQSDNSKIQPNQNTGNLITSKSSCLKINTNNYSKPTNLMSLKLRPPPIQILKKWLTPQFDPSNYWQSTVPIGKPRQSTLRHDAVPFFPKTNVIASKSIQQCPSVQSEFSRPIFNRTFNAADDIRVVVRNKRRVGNIFC
jgi:hypothetical protein